MCCSLVAAQQGASTQSSAPVPRLVNFTGKAADAQRLSSFAFRFRYP
jgi:hypothetical protein